MVNLSGGARRHEFSTDDGLRFDGPDGIGSASFLPAGCERRLRLHGVEWHWASITLGGTESAPMSRQLKSAPAFCSVRDPVIASVLGEMARVHEADGALDPAYCETFAAMLTVTGVVDLTPASYADTRVHVYQDIFGPGSSSFVWAFNWNYRAERTGPPTFACVGRSPVTAPCSWIGAPRDARRSNRARTQRRVGAASPRRHADDSQRRTGIRRGAASVAAPRRPVRPLSVGFRRALFR